MPPGTSAQPQREWHFPNRATPLGSPAYYAVRFSNPARRHRNAMLLGWVGEIETIADRPQDPGVARLRLDWWRNEVATLGSGQTRHPLLLGMREQGIDGGAVAHLLAILDAAESRIMNAPPANDAEFAEQCRGSMGGLFRLLATLDHEPAADAATCADAGGYCAAVACLQRLAERPHRLPATAQARQLRTLDRGRRLERLDRLVAVFAGPYAYRDLPDLAARLYALHAANHRKMRRLGYPVDSLVDRPPIAHLWTAWRCR